MIQILIYEAYQKHPTGYSQSIFQVWEAPQFLAINLDNDLTDQIHLDNSTYRIHQGGKPYHIIQNRFSKEQFLSSEK